MTIKFHHPLPFPLLMAAVALGLTCQVSSQTFTTVYSFSAISWLSSGSLPHTNSDGAVPNAALVLSGNTLYGTANQGGSGGVGTVFALNTDGSSFTTLYTFSADPNNTGNGYIPHGGLVLSSNTLYGTTGHSFGTFGGTVFAINTDGTGFTPLFGFTTTSPFDSDGNLPQTPLVLSGGALYGTTYYGGSGNGTVFGVNTDGSGFATIYSFTGPFTSNSVTNIDGAVPQVELVLGGNTLYGMTETGGDSSRGTVFAVNTDGTGFRVLHSFSAIDGPTGTNSDGANYLETYIPTGNPRLVLSGTVLYGTAELGGSGAEGTIFAVNTDGTGFTVLHNFAGSSDGAVPSSLLVSPDKVLYGMTARGGASGEGTVFAINADGTGFSTLHSFTAQVFNSGISAYVNSDGLNPNSLVWSNSTLYGTTTRGGSGGSGTIFRIALSTAPPQLTITSAGANVILTWPTNSTGFSLQSSTNLATPVWATNLPAPFVVNGQNTVTNPIAGLEQFYRLAQ